MKSIINLLRKLTITTVICFMTVTSLPVSVFAEETTEEPVVEKQEETVKEETPNEEIHVEEEKAVEEQEEQKQEELPEVVEEQQKEEVVEEAKEEQTKEEVKEEFPEVVEEQQKEETTKQQEEQEKEIAEELVEEKEETEIPTLPELPTAPMLMATPKLTSGSSRPTATLHKNNGEDDSTQEAKYVLEYGVYGSKCWYYETPSTPTKKGYELLGWYTDKDTLNNKYTKFGLTNTNKNLSNIDLYAKWSPITYTVEFKAGDGSGSMNNQTFIADETKTLSEFSFTPETGYEFNYWQRSNLVGIDLDGTYSNKQTVCIPDCVDVGKTLYLVAKYKLINYTLQYSLDGGQVTTANKESYTIETELFTLNEPTKTNCIFSGWTCSEIGLTVPTKSVSIEKGSTGNRTYVANWEDNPDLVISNAVVSVDKTTFDYSGDVQKPNVSAVTINSNTVDSSNYEIKYSNENSKDVGEYSLTITGKGDYKGQKVINYTINKVTSSITVSPKEDVYYIEGTAQDLVSVISNAKQTVQYHIVSDKYNSVAEKAEFYATVANSNAKWSTDCKKTEVGKYYVYYRVKGTDNYTGIDASTDNYVIAYIKSKDLKYATITIANKELEYTGSPLYPSISVSINGNTLDTNSYELSYSSAAPTSVGTYTVTATGKGDYTGTISDTYQIVKISVSADIEGKTGLKYTGSPQELITVTENPSFGKIEYLLRKSLTEKPEEKEGWTETKPTATEAGTYYIYYRVKGDGVNYNDYGGTALYVRIVNIAKNKIQVNGNDISTLNKAIKANSGLAYTGKAQELVAFKGDDVVKGYKSGSLEYSLDTEDWSSEVPTATDAGVYLVYYRLKGDDSHNDFGFETPDVVEVTIEQATLKASNFEVVITQGESEYGSTVTYNSEVYTASIVGKFGEDNEFDLVKGTDYLIYNGIIPNTVISTDDLEQTNAGTYTIYISAINSKNYQDTGIVIEKEWTINPYDISELSLQLKGDYALIEKYNGSGELEKQTQEYEIKDGLGNDIPTDILEEINGLLKAHKIGEEDLPSNEAYCEGKYEMKFVGTGNYTGTLSKQWGIVGKHISDINSEFYVGDYEVKNSPEENPIATLGTTDHKLIGAVATPEDLSEIASGKKFEVVISSSKVDEMIIEEIKADVEKKASPYNVALYLDITLHKQFGEDVEQITNTNGKITIVIQLDDEFVKKYGKTNRIFKIVRVHKDDLGTEYELLDAKYDATNKTLTFESDKFSYFVVVYKDPSKSSHLSYEVVNTSTGGYVIEPTESNILYLPKKEEDEE